MDAGSKIDRTGTQAFINLLRFYSSGREANASFSGNLLTKEALDEVAASTEKCCPSFDDRNGRYTPNYVARKAFAGLLSKGLDWQAVRDEAKKLSQEMSLQRERREDETMKTEIVPIETLGDSPKVRFARRWSTAWSSRNLELLLSFFDDNGVYRDAHLEEEASGKTALRKLFASVFHKCDMSLLVEGIGMSSDSIVLRWARKGTRLEGVEFPKGRYDFRGQSVVKLSSNRVVSCENSWDVGDGLMYVLIWRRRTQTGQPG